MVFEKCREILLKESELVQQIAGLQNIIRKAVINRDWTDFECHFDVLGKLGAQCTALESERERLFTGIRETANYSARSATPARFYTFVMRFPAEQRAELTSIYRGLKLETLRVRMAGQSLMDYIAGARATMNGFFRIAFPDRGGKIYTPYGIPVSHDMRSMVLNRTF